VSQWNGGITGTFEQETGKSAGTASVLSRVYNTGGNSIDQPCPICSGADIPNDGSFDETTGLNGTCVGGARATASRAIATASRRFPRSATRASTARRAGARWWRRCRWT
jgi:hypothetical protein